MFCPKITNGIRTIPLLNILKDVLQKRLGESKDDELVFKNDNGGMHTARSIANLWTRFLKNYNEFINMNIENEEDKIEAKFTMHQFRHPFATILYNAGVDIKTAQDVLGHATINITLDIYTHLEEKQKKINTDRLNDFVLNQSKISQNEKKDNCK